MPFNFRMFLFNTENAENTEGCAAIFHEPASVQDLLVSLVYSHSDSHILSVSLCVLSVLCGEKEFCELQKACYMLSNSLENSTLKCHVMNRKVHVNAQILSRIQPKTAAFRPTKA